MYTSPVLFTFQKQPNLRLLSSISLQPAFFKRGALRSTFVRTYSWSDSAATTALADVPRCLIVREEDGQYVIPGGSHKREVGDEQATQMQRNASFSSSKSTRHRLNENGFLRLGKRYATRFGIFYGNWLDLCHLDLASDPAGGLEDPQKLRFLSANS